MTGSNKEQIPEVVLRDKEVNALRNALLSIPDSRRKRHHRYEYAIMLTILIYATLCGYVGASGAARYSKAHDAYLINLFNLNGIPTAPAFKNVIDSVDQKAVTEVVSAWIDTCSPDIIERYSNLSCIQASKEAKRKPEQKIIRAPRAFGSSIENDKTAAISHDLIKKKYGSNMKLVDIIENKKAILLHIESTTKSAVCPYCKKESHSHLQKVDRYIWDVSVSEKIVIVHVVFYRYRCNNPKCIKSSFREELPFVLPRTRRTIDVDASLLGRGITTSFRGVAKDAKSNYINVSASTIGRIFRRIEMIVDKPVTKIGVDDVSKRRGITYYTIIYDYDTHLPYALLDGRDGTELEKWLKEHPCISVIMRDRSGDYTDAIVRVYGGRVKEIADRFHLMQNINKHLQDELYKVIKETHFFAEMRDNKDLIITTEAHTASAVQPEEDDPWETIIHEPVDLTGGENQNNNCDCNTVIPVVTNLATGTNELEIDSSQCPSNNASEPCYHLIDKQHPRIIVPELPANFPHLSYTDDPPCNPDGSLIQYDCSLQTKEEKEKTAQRRLEKEKKKQEEEQENQKKKLIEERELAIRIRSTYADIHKISGIPVAPDYIAFLLRLDRCTVRKYLKMSDQDVQNITVQKPEIVKPKKKPDSTPVIWKVPNKTVLNIIYKMQSDRWDDWTIFLYVFHHPKFAGSPVTLEHYINCIGSNNFPWHKTFRLRSYVKPTLPPNIVHFTRTDISRNILTVNPKTKRDKVVDSVMCQLKERYPIITRIQSCVFEFHDILEGYEVEPLFTWIAKYKDLLPGFCEGLLRDIDAVKNAIVTDYSSGFVEGSNNAFKLIKRIGSGKYSTVGLLNKLTLYLARKLDVVDYHEIVRTGKFVITSTCSLAM